MSPNNNDENELSDIVTAPSTGSRIRHGLLLGMLKVTEGDNRATDDDESAILREIFENQFRMSTAYSQDASYVDETLEIYRQLVDVDKIGPEFDDMMANAYKEEARYFRPAYSDFARVMQIAKKAMIAKKEAGQGQLSLQLIRRFVEPLKPFFGIVNPGQEMVLKDYFTQNTHTQNGVRLSLTPEESQNIVADSDNNKLPFHKKSVPARTLIKAFLHECYQDDGHMDPYEHSLVKGISEVAGEFSEADMKELDEERKQEDRLQINFVDKFIMGCVKILERPIRTADLDELIESVKGITTKEIQAIYNSIKDGNADKLTIEEFLDAKGGNISLMSNSDIEDEEDILLTPYEMVQQIQRKDGSLSPSKFERHIRKYCAKQDLRSRVVENVRNFQALIDMACSDGVVTAKEFNLLRYAAKYAYGIRDDLVFEKMLSPYNKDNRIVICTVTEDTALEERTRATGYITKQIVLRNLLRQRKDGGEVNGWIEAFNTVFPDEQEAALPDVIILHDELYPSNSSHEATEPFTDRNKDGDVLRTSWGEMTALAHDTVSDYAQARAIPVIPLRVTEDRDKFLNVLADITQAIHDKK